MPAPDGPRGRRWKRRRTPPGSAPGTLTVDPAAHPPEIELWAFGPDSAVESHPKSVEELRGVAGKQPVTWINIDGLGDAEVVRRMGEMFGIHPLTQEDILNNYQRPKIEPYGDHLFLVCRMFNLGRGALSTEQLSLYLVRDCVLTFQEIPGDCFDPLRRRLRDPGAALRRRRSDYLAYALVDAVIDGYFPVLEELGDRLERIEDEILRRPDPSTVERVHLIKRDLFQLRRAVWPLREALGSLVREPQPLISEETRIYFRDCYDHCVQIIDLLETYRELCADLTDVYLSSVSFRTNEIMRVLTVISTIFIPLTFLAGVWGMNFDPDTSPYNMPELRMRYGYPIALGGMVLLAAVMLIYFARRRWLRSGGTEGRSRRAHGGRASSLATRRSGARGGRRGKGSDPGE